jgi:hydrogenase nickel incorporation protein HypA/HybF
MHEMALAEGVLQLIEDAAREQKFERVTTVWLEIGQLSGVEVEAMKFCFDAVMRDSIADGATLEIVATPGTGWCMACSMYGADERSIRRVSAVRQPPDAGHGRHRVAGQGT